MEEVSLEMLDGRLRKQVGAARRALDGNNPGYAMAVCARVLRHHPGCVEVRRVLRRAQMENAGENSVRSRMLSAVAPLSVKWVRDRAVGRHPEQALQKAEDEVSQNPFNRSAHLLLATAAEALEMWRTAALAYETIRELDPDNRSNLKHLARVYYNLGKMDDAIHLGDQLLEQAGEDAEVQNLIRRATVRHTLQSACWEEGSDYGVKDVPQALHESEEDAGESRRET